MRRLLAPALALALLAGAAEAVVQPGERLDDPALEARARDISSDLRCLVCRNESIDESNADFAKTLRLLVRERLAEGDTDAEVVDYVVARYGDYVLLRPRFDLANAWIWLAGPAIFAAGAFGAWRFLRRRPAAAEPAPLSPEEARRLEALLRD